MGTYLGEIPIGVVLGGDSVTIDNEVWFILNGSYVLETEVDAVLNGQYDLKEENL